MKKQTGKGVTANRIDADEILPQYDFKRASPNRFASRYHTIVDVARSKK